eukprot:2626653-Amphidinium_carterae.1
MGGRVCLDCISQLSANNRGQGAGGNGRGLRWNVSTTTRRREAFARPGCCTSLEASPGVSNIESI